MTIHPLAKYWQMIYSVIQEFWAITEPAIEDAAVKNDVPVELYYYGELGLDYFSVESFQKRDPFSNPEQFEKQFVRLNVKGWIEPVPDDQYRVTEKAREAVKKIVEAGDARLPPAESFKDTDLERLKVLVKQIALSNDSADEPPEKWAVLKRFRVANRNSPVLVKIREYLMDLFAYRDDAHLAAARPHFNQAGIVWNVLGAVWSGTAVTAARMAETMAFRGYEAGDYEVALQAAREIGWLEEADPPGAFRLTEKGRELREQVESQIDDYFYKPWSVLTQGELDELYDLLTKLRDQLRELRKKQ
jgi:DNA-binding PadR family transcriptional regulator